MQITVEPVTSKRQVKEFVRLPYRLYADDPNWVPQLLADDYKKLDKSTHPFFQHAEAEFFLARRDGKPVGRIAAIHDRLWEERYEERCAYWGWYECENDPAAAKALFDAAFAWAKKRGCTRIIGPMTPNANELVGTLVDGFRRPALHHDDLQSRLPHPAHRGKRQPQVEGPVRLARWTAPTSPSAWRRSCRGSRRTGSSRSAS